MTGKYLNGAKPEGARLSLFPDYDRYSNANAVAATAAYVKLAQDHGLDAAQMALAYINSRQFVTANIIGATTMEQLESNINSVSMNLSTEVVEQIEDIHVRFPNPSP